jgi:hypothetical protein
MVRGRQWPQACADMIDDTGLKAHRTAASLLKGADSLTFSGAQKVA